MFIFQRSQMIQYVLTEHPEYFVYIFRTFSCIFFRNFVRADLRTTIKYIKKVQSKSENPKQSAAVPKFYAYKRSEVPGIQKFTVYKTLWIYSACAGPCSVWIVTDSFRILLPFSFFFISMFKCKFKFTRRLSQSN